MCLGFTSAPLLTHLKAEMSGEYTSAAVKILRVACAGPANAPNFGTVAKRGPRNEVRLSERYRPKV